MPMDRPCVGPSSEDYEWPGSIHQAGWRVEVPPRFPLLIPGGGGPIAGHQTSEEVAFCGISSPLSFRRERWEKRWRLQWLVVGHHSLGYVVGAPLGRSRDIGDLVGGVVAGDGVTTTRNQR
ncbi:hypothetical protein CRG98_016236 [Punica granatum]|uniref:Uncharacterized protein n=1 Tax=Punica granatum TaxID=22663 RepID=A0A2I0K466_PUNGR|nr:hypothetical protein CRG98_016236 [Punica granatum]